MKHNDRWLAIGMCLTLVVSALLYTGWRSRAQSMEVRAYLPVVLLNSGPVSIGWRLVETCCVARNKWTAKFELTTRGGVGPFVYCYSVHPGENSFWYCYSGLTHKRTWVYEMVFQHEHEWGQFGVEDTHQLGSNSRTPWNATLRCD
jgi:hypothetical protein